MSQTPILYEMNLNPLNGGTITPASFTADTTVDVGTGSNRYCIVFITYYNAGTPQPATCRLVGADTFTQIATGINGSGYKCALFHGPVTATGIQTIEGTTTGSTGAEGGGFLTAILVVQGTGALTYGNTTAIAASAASGVTRTRSVATASGDEVWMMLLEFTNGLSAAADTGTTEVHDSTLHWIGRKTEVGNPTEIGAAITGVADTVYVGFTLTEAGGGGGAAALVSGPIRSFATRRASSY